ncbi:MAG: hypothetical protein ACLP8S_25330 [Solirubrobacteraceae bacterium]
MTEPTPRRFARLKGRKPNVPSERDWERSALLAPRAAPAAPELVSDGGGLPFPPAALAQAAGALDPADPAIDALLALIARQRKPKDADYTSPAPDAWPAAPGSLDGWRVLARTDDDVLFGRGLPPRLLTVAMRRDAKRDKWTSLATNASRPLRSTRDGIRASRWRLDPTRATSPDQSVLRVLVTEQTFAGGKRADGRLLAPDLYVGAGELVLTMFVTPRPGFQTRSQNPETPARIALPGPIGTRALIDGALYPRPLAEIA